MTEANNKEFKDVCNQNNNLLLDMGEKVRIRQLERLEHKLKELEEKHNKLNVKRHDYEKLDRTHNITYFLKDVDTQMEEKSAFFHKLNKVCNDLYGVSILINETKNFINKIS